MIKVRKLDIRPSVPEEASLWKRFLYLLRLWRWHRQEKRAQSIEKIISCYGEQVLAKRKPRIEGKSKSQITGILSELGAEDFDPYRIDVLRFMCQKGLTISITSDDVCQILAEFDYDNYRMRALRILRQYVRDSSNWFSVINWFDSKSNQHKALLLWPPLPSNLEINTINPYRTTKHIEKKT